MHGILKVLSDPEWWFTTVFIAIIVSVFAPFLKGALLTGLAKISTSFRARKERRDRQFKKEVALIFHDRTLLIHYVCRLICIINLIGVLIIANIVSCCAYLTVRALVSAPPRILFYLYAINVMSGISSFILIPMAAPIFWMMVKALWMYQRSIMEKA